MAHHRILRTLQLGKSWFPEQQGSGLDRVYYALVNNLHHAQVEVRGLVAGSAQVQEQSGGVVHAFAPATASLWVRAQGMRRALREHIDLEAIDLVASHFALYTFPILDLLRDKPLVVHFHGPWAGESRVEGAHIASVKAKTILEEAVYRKGQRFIVLSEAFRDVLHQEYGIPMERIRIIPGGVQVDQFDTGRSRAEARDRLGWPQDRPIVLSVRRLARRMGLENLIDAMQQVAQQVPEVLLLIAGKGEIADELQARIESRGLKEHVRLLGFVPDDDLPLAYRAATLSVVPTVALEGFGLITVESLAAGTPVVVTPVGGLPEVVRDLSEDLICDGATVQDLSDRITAILTGDLAVPSDETCQSYARTRFDWPVIARKTRTVYEEVLS